MSDSLWPHDLQLASFLYPWDSLSIGFSKQEYWSGLPFPSPGYLPNPGIKFRSPALQAVFFTSWAITEVSVHRLLHLYFILLIFRLSLWAYKTAQLSSILNYNTSSLHSIAHLNQGIFFLYLSLVTLLKGWFLHTPSTPLDLLTRIWILFPSQQ